MLNTLTVTPFQTNSPLPSCRPNCCRLISPSSVMVNNRIEGNKYKLGSKKLSKSWKKNKCQTTSKCVRFYKDDPKT